MIRVMLAIIMAFCLSGAAYADLGDPTIQAVCRVTLINGKTHEGLIVIGVGGYQGIWMNGFYLAGDYGGPLFFTLDFNRLVRNSDASYQPFDCDGKKIHLDSHDKPVKLHFLEKMGNTAVEVKSVTEGQGTYLVNRSEIKYKMLRTLTIITDLPYHLYLPGSDDDAFAKSKKLAIPTDQIAIFELLREPPTHWLELIEKKRKEGERKLKDAEDYMEPAWYHEVLRNRGSEEFTQLKQIIESNLRKWEVR